MLFMWGPASLHSFFKCDKKVFLLDRKTMCAKLYVFFLLLML